MEPSEALFDAINRGDIAVARDAVSRGADLNSRNVLGMTPIDLSIDLGRNDITFMLLSLRGGEESRARAVAPEPQPRTTQARQAPPRPAPRPVATAPAASPSQTARLYSSDGGTPNPSAGFLGFDSGRR